MVKALLVSILFATVAIPTLAARDPSPRRGLWRALIGTLLFDAVYLFVARFVLPRLGM
jgi:hypothetical protein